MGASTPVSAPNPSTTTRHDRELRFGLQPLTKRDAAAAPLLEMFDFDHAPFAQPPTLAAAVIDPAHALDCEQNERPRRGSESA
ncbi:MAG: hypothetical protein ACXVEG_12295 [Actinomycetota bacterium]